MLRELSIRHFAIINEQTVSFGPGLNVISGETGTGKSVILQALEVILGGRPKPKYIKEETDGWEIQALFDLKALPEEIRRELPDMIEGDELIVSRTMNTQGRGKVFINGRLGTVQLLQEICSILVQICAQGGQSRLLEPEYHLSIIDDFSSTGDDLGHYQSLWRSYKQKSDELAEINEKKERSVLRSAELQYLIEEIEKLSLTEDLREEIETQIRRESSKQDVLDGANTVAALFEDHQGILAQMDTLTKELGKLARLNKEFEPLGQKAGELSDASSELEGEISQLVSSYEVDSDELEAARERLSELARVERKYRTDTKGLMRLLAEAQKELSQFYDDSYRRALEQEVKDLHRNLSEAADTLSKKRGSATQMLVDQVQSELADLSMSGSALHIEHHKGDFTAAGIDHMEIMLSSQGGRKRLSLREIASGGELSRILLVLKKVLRDKSGVNVLVFDEVDTGISGKVARAVGEKLKSISDQSQVICITHLAQVASLADHHFVVRKSEDSNSIFELSSEEKIEEIARMLAGYKVTPASRESARELLSSI